MQKIFALVWALWTVGVLPAAAQVGTAAGQWQKLISQSNQLEVVFPENWEVRDTSDGVTVHHITDTSIIQVHIRQPWFEEGQLQPLDSLAEIFRQFTMASSLSDDHFLDTAFQASLP